MADNSGIVLPEPPPPRPTAYAVLAFILNLLAVVALCFGRYTLGTWLAVGALVFSGITAYLLSRQGGGGGASVQGTPTGANPTGANPTGTAAR
jgi:hypothetical protein